MYIICDVQAEPLKMLVGKIMSKMDFDYNLIEITITGSQTVFKMHSNWCYLIGEVEYTEGIESNSSLHYFFVKFLGSSHV